MVGTSNTFNCMVFLGKQNIKAFNLISVLQPFLLLVGLLFYIFSIKSYTSDAYLYPLLMSFSVSTVISSFLILKKITNKKNKTYKLKPILMNGLAFQAGLLMYLFCNKFSYYVLSDKASVGLYSSATVIAESVLIVANAIAPVLLSKVANQTNTTKNVELSLSLSKLSFVLSLFGLLIILIVPDSFFVLILGKGFVGIKQIITLYSPGVLAMSAMIPLTNYLSASGKQVTILWSYCFGLLITLFMAPLMVTRFGNYGAAITSNVTFLTILVVMNYKLIKENNLSFAHYFSFKVDNPFDR
jgi:O-antigen/teichoic acid export membrane protein